MTSPLISRILCVVVPLCMLPGLALAAEAVSATPGKTVCSHGTGNITGSSDQLELCITQSAGFSHVDSYALKVNGKQVIESSAEETLKGKSGKLGNAKITLTCEPRLKAPDKVSDIMISTYQRTMKVSEEEARKMAIREASVETGRMCSIRSNDNVVDEVLFNFR